MAGGVNLCHCRGTISLRIRGPCGESTASRATYGDADDATQRRLPSFPPTIPTTTTMGAIYESTTSPSSPSAFRTHSTRRFHGCRENLAAGSRSLGIAGIGYPERAPAPSALSRLANEHLLPFFSLPAAIVPYLGGNGAEAVQSRAASAAADFKQNSPSFFPSVLHRLYSCAFPKRLDRSGAKHFSLRAPARRLRVKLPHHRADAAAEQGGRPPRDRFSQSQMKRENPTIRPI